MYKELIEEIPIVVKYPAARKNGRGYKMVCPFHDDKNPSMTIFPNGSYYCHGCGASGDYISYVMKLKNMDFISALKEIEVTCGVKIPMPSGGKIVEIMNDTVDFYHGHVDKVRDYLKSRGLTDETIAAFKLGYAPGRRSLLTHLMAKYSPDDIKKAGLLSESTGMDFFYNRLIIPIKNGVGYVALAGRSLDDTEPKYLNSPETEIFKKGNILFGMNIKGIRQFRFAALVEGYFDVMTLHQDGFINTVGCMGTALSEKQVSILGHHTKQVYVALDDDGPGQNAACKAIWRCLSSGLDSFSVNLKGCDPDEFIRNGNSFEDAVAEAVTGEVFLYKRIGDPEEEARLITLIAKKGSATLLPHLKEGARDLHTELSARALIESRRRLMKVVYRKGKREVRMLRNILVAFNDSEFVFWKGFTGDRLKAINRMTKILEGL